MILLQGTERQEHLQALKTIEKKGLQAMAKDIGLDLEKLPFEDVRKARTEWLAKQPKNPPQVRQSAWAVCLRLFCTLAEQKRRTLGSLLD